MKESEKDLLIEIMVFKLNAVVRNYAIYPQLTNGNIEFGNHKNCRLINTTKKNCKQFSVKLYKGSRFVKMLK